MVHIRAENGERFLHFLPSLTCLLCYAVLAQKLKDQVTKLYEKAFSVEEVATAIINDVNAPEGELSLAILRLEDSPDNCVHV